MDLNDVLDEKEPERAEAPETPAAPVEKAEAPAVETVTSSRKAHQEKESEAQGRVRDPDTGQFVAAKPAEAPAAPPEKAAEAPAAPPAAPAPALQEYTEKEKAFLRVAHEERQKRQALEAELTKLRQPPEPPKPFWDDPEAARAADKQEVHALVTRTRIDTSEMIARSKYTDFDEKAAKFTELAQSMPMLVHQMQQAAHPAEFAYATAKAHMELQAAGSIDAMRAKIEAETRAKVRAEVEAEIKAKDEAARRVRDSLPPSLSDTRSTGVNRPVWGGPTSLDEVLK